MKRKASILSLIFLLVIGGGYFAYEGLKIELKAKVAQVLLQHAWYKTLQTGKYYQPWPSFDGKPILLLEIPSHNISQIVLNGTSGQSLAFGPSFHEESFLPHEQKVTIISSHRDSHGVYIKKLQLASPEEVLNKIDLNTNPVLQVQFVQTSTNKYFFFILAGILFVFSLALFRFRRRFY